MVYGFPLSLLKPAASLNYPKLESSKATRESYLNKKKKKKE